jgi:hypothetical protein
MLKVIQIKLIHVLGGYTKDEYDSQCRTNFIKGKLVRNIEIQTLMKLIKGVSKQEWIDIIYNEVCPQEKSN